MPLVPDPPIQATRPPWISTERGSRLRRPPLEKIVLLLVAILLAWLALRVFRMAMRLVFLALAVAMFTAVYYMFKKSKR